MQPTLLEITMSDSHSTYVGPRGPSLPGCMAVRVTPSYAQWKGEQKYINGAFVQGQGMRLKARLRAFAAFARRRSFSAAAAAAELRISQPAISKHIAELEHALGLKLVER